MVQPLGNYAIAATTRSSDEVMFPTNGHDAKKASMIEKLQRWKKPIYAVLICLTLILVGVCIAMSSDKSSRATTESAQKLPSKSSPDNPEQTEPETPTNSDTATSPISSTNWDFTNVSTSSSMDGEVSAIQSAVLNLTDTYSSNTSTPTDPSTSSSNTTSSSTPPSLGGEPTTPSPNSLTDANPLPYSILDFDWTNPAKWEYASGAPVSPDMVTRSGITLTPQNSAEPIRTIEGWSGEKVVFVEWERTSSSDTNIWMLNTKLQAQFGKGIGWPYWGELDLFEMFTQDKVTSPTFDYSGYGGFSDVASYGQMTMHMGPAVEDGNRCYCPASASKNLWYQNTAPMTSGCTAQFSNDASNSIAAIWGSDSTGQYIQLMQKPTITKGGKRNGIDTYDIASGTGAVTSKIYNNAELFWGNDASVPCAKAGGHNPATGFPFFESFRLVLEEQKKNDASASFTVKNIQIFTKN